MFELALVLVLVQIDLRLEESPDRCMTKALVDYHRSPRRVQCIQVAHSSCPQLVHSLYRACNPFRGQLLPHAWLVGVIENSLAVSHCIPGPPFVFAQTSRVRVVKAATPQGDSILRTQQQQQHDSDEDGEADAPRPERPRTLAAIPRKACSFRSHKRTQELQVLR